MTNNFHIFYWPCSLYLFLMPLAVMAQSDERSALTASATALDFGYQEFDDSGTLLNREDGAIPGVAVSHSHSHGRWLFVGDFSYHAGSVAYSGQTNTGIAITTRTHQVIVDMALRTEYWQDTFAGLEYAFYLGTGYHRWERDIQPTRTVYGAPVSGLFETYQWWLGFAGIRAVLYESDRARWLLDARLTRTVNPSVTVDYNGLYDNTRLYLGERWGGRLAFPLHYTLGQAASFVVEPFVERYELGRSATLPLTRNGLPVDALYEPRSETRNFGLMIGINQYF